MEPTRSEAEGGLYRGLRKRHPSKRTSFGSDRLGGGGGSRTYPYSFRFSKLLKTLTRYNRSNRPIFLSEVRIKYAGGCGWASRGRSAEWTRRSPANNEHEDGEEQDDRKAGEFEQRRLCDVKPSEATNAELDHCVNLSTGFSPLPTPAGSNPHAITCCPVSDLRREPSDGTTILFRANFLSRALGVRIFSGRGGP